jgi:hypothetical protein
VPPMVEELLDPAIVSPTLLAVLLLLRLRCSGWSDESPVKANRLPSPFDDDDDVVEDADAEDRVDEERCLRSAPSN